jgi:allantoate deiminase
MAERSDALAAAAELVLAVEAVGRAGPGLVATVGEIAAEPGARNVIPGAALFTVDVRHADPAALERAEEALTERAEDIAYARGVNLDLVVAGANEPVAMSARLSDALAAAIAAQGLPVERLPSGAGHDAATMASLTDAAMLFVRCRGGISHHPDEHVEEADVAVAIDVMERFLRGL